MTTKKTENNPAAIGPTGKDVETCKPINVSAVCPLTVAGCLEKNGDEDACALVPTNAEVRCKNENILLPETSIKGMTSIAEGHPKLEERIGDDGAKCNCTATAVIKPHEIFEKEEVFKKEVKVKIKKGKKQVPYFTIRWSWLSPPRLHALTLPTLLTLSHN